VTRPDTPLFVALDWIPAHCVVPTGFHKGHPFRLYNYQLRYLSAFYTVKGSAQWVPEDPVLGPAFRYSAGLLVGPQKIGKGPYMATHICLEAVGPALFAGWANEGDVYECDGRNGGCDCGWTYYYEPGEPRGMAWPTPLIQLTAYSQDQTDNVYLHALKPMIENGPLASVLPKTGEEFIRLPGGGKIETVTSSAMSRLGAPITFAPQDEVGLWNKSNKMEAVADNQHRGLAGMGAARR
jgi:hypothetical protein